MAELPGASFGTYTLKGESCQSDVLAALRAGFRSVDTAAIYKNEGEVGRAILASGVPRDELFLTTKLSPQDAVHGHDRVIASCMQSLQRLQQPFVDLYLMHWPGVAGLRPEDPANVGKRQEAWYAMEQLQKRGLCRRIGVSNFNEGHLASIGCGSERIVPYINQLELHPLCRQHSIVSHCLSRGMLVQQYSPLAKGDRILLEHPVLLDIAKQFDNLCQGSVAKLCLLWGIAHDFKTVIRCSSRHLQDNVDLFSRYGALSTSQPRLQNNDNADLRKASAAVDEALSALPDHHVCWFSDKVA